MRYIIFYGLLWGIVEATVGHILHIVPFLSGMKFLPPSVMLPVGVYAMTSAKIASGKDEYIFYTALFTASIKMIDIVVSPDIGMVLNPAISILLEGLIFYGVVKLFEKYNDYVRFAITLGVWEISYFLISLILPFKNISNASFYIILQYFLITLFLAYFFYLFTRNIKSYRNISYAYAYIGVFILFILKIVNTIPHMH